MQGLLKTAFALVLGAIIAAGGYFTKAYTLDEAVAVATDTSKATKACETLLAGQGYVVETPAEEPPADDAE